MTQITITISPEANSFAEKYSKDTGRTKSRFINWIILNFKKKVENGGRQI